MDLNSLLSRTLNKYSDLRRCDRAYHEITFILSLHDDPEMRLFRTLISTSRSNGMQNRKMEEKLEHLVQSLSNKMKSSAAVSSLDSVKTLASAKTNEREVNVRKILENYGKRKKVTNRLFQVFFEDVKNLNLLLSDLTEKEVEGIDIPDLDCNISELDRDLSDRMPSIEEHTLSICAQWVLREFEVCLSQLEDGRKFVNSRISQETGGFEVGAHLVEDRGGKREEDLVEERGGNREVGSLQLEMEKTDNKSSEHLAEVGVLREERDKLAARLEVEIKGREQLMGDKQELVNEKEELNRKVERLEAETKKLASEKNILMKHLKGRVVSGASQSRLVQSGVAEAEALNSDKSSEPVACSTPKKSKDGSERGHFFSFEDRHKAEDPQVDRREEREVNSEEGCANEAANATQNRNPVACSSRKKFAGGSESEREHFYLIQDIQEVVGELHGVGGELMDFFELISDFFELISEQSGVVSRKIVDVILEESPLLLKTKQKNNIENHNHH